MQHTQTRFGVLEQQRKLSEPTRASFWAWLPSEKPSTTFYRLADGSSHLQVYEAMSVASYVDLIGLCERFEVVRPFFVDVDVKECTEQFNLHEELRRLSVVLSEGYGAQSDFTAYVLSASNDDVTSYHIHIPDLIVEHGTAMALKQQWVSKVNASGVPNSIAEKWLDKMDVKHGNLRMAFCDKVLGDEPGRPVASRPLLPYAIVRMKGGEMEFDSIVEEDNPEYRLQWLKWTSLYTESEPRPCAFSPLATARGPRAIPTKRTVPLDDVPPELATIVRRACNDILGCDPNDMKYDFLKGRIEAMCRTKKCVYDADGRHDSSPATQYLHFDALQGNVYVICAACNKPANGYKFYNVDFSAATASTEQDFLGLGSLTIEADNVQHVFNDVLARVLENASYFYYTRAGPNAPWDREHKMSQKALFQRFGRYKTRVPGERFPTMAIKYWDKNFAEHFKGWVFRAPGTEPEEMLNGYQGWPRMMLPKESVNSVFVDALRNHINSVLSPSDAATEFVMDLIAYKVQHPFGELLPALAIRGPQGCGKSVFANIIGNMFGAHFHIATDSYAMMGPYDYVTPFALVVLYEECVFSPDPKQANTMKNRIYGTTIQVNQKYQPMLDIENHAWSILLTNNERSCPLDGGRERRYVTLVGTPKTLNGDEHRQYYEQLWKLAKIPECQQHLLSYFMHRPTRSISELRNKCLIEELFKKEWDMQCSFSTPFNPVRVWLSQCLSNRFLAGKTWLEEGETVVTSDALYQDYLSSGSRIPGARTVAKNAFCRSLAGMLCHHLLAKRRGTYDGRSMRNLYHVKGTKMVEELLGEDLSHKGCCQRSNL